MGDNILEILSELKEERYSGSVVITEFSNFDYWVNWDDIEEILLKYNQEE